MEELTHRMFVIKEGDDEEPVEAEYSLGEMSNCEQQEEAGCRWFSQRSESFEAH